MDQIKLFNDIDTHIIKDKKPSEYLNGLLNEGILEEYPFSMLSDLKSVGQNTKYHPEGNVWNHTMLVMDEAANVKVKSKNERAFMWAALLHDIGKKPTTRLRNGKITSYNHDSVGKSMTVDFLKYFKVDNAFIESVAALVRWHMQPLFTAKDLPFSNIEKMLSEVTLDEISLLTLCDRLGRGEMSEEKVNDEKKGIAIFIQKCKKIMESGKDK